MTLEQARNLAQGGWIHHVSEKDKKGNPIRFRVTSVETWKRQPKSVEVRVKYGLYRFLRFNESQIWQLEVGDGR